jgi:chromosome partitioning protein
VQRTAREALLSEVLAGVKADYILIDCPPSLGIITLNALVASDRVIIPTQCEYLALRGLALFYRTLRKVQGNKRLNPELEVFGILPTFYDSRLLHADEVIEAMESRGLPVLPVKVRRSVRFAESALAHTTILEYDPRNPSVKAYQELARMIDNETV